MSKCTRKTEDVDVVLLRTPKDKGFYEFSAKDELVVSKAHNNFTPEENIIINLVKEEDNEHDPDAIAAYLNGQKIGYVANSDYTLIDEVKSASKIKTLIKDDSQAKILFVYLDEYIIAKLL